MKSFIGHLLGSLLALLLLIIVGVVWWVTIPSPITPLEYRVDLGGGKETLVCRVTQGIYAIWRHEVVVPETGWECHDSGMGFYQAGTTMVTWDINPALFPCLAHPGSVSRITWTPLAFGVIPLRTVELVVPYELAVQAPTLKFGDLL